ncbi:RidA family protein [Christiangramia fulva]|uniref:RidA family protein n=1 Tax=Christiangramia fulva TaxID=2126553 RepID=A0A2R3Z540_9FLAO|nr:RidA family protein [Christiangramia fulva]AVR45396.1 RidA family protein [Christiangramia fulva]
MKKRTILNKHLLLLFGVTFLLTFSFLSCDQKEKENPKEMEKETIEITKTEVPEKPEYFLLRPELEKTYGYSHAVKIGNDLKISGAVSMDNDGNLLAEGDMRQQMKNVYSDLEKILKHYGYSFDDVVVENVYTTNMAKFIEVSTFRDSIYKKQFPTGTWLEVKGLALPGQLIEIDMEAHKSE